MKTLLQTMAAVMLAATMVPVCANELNDAIRDKMRSGPEICVDHMRRLANSMSAISQALKKTGGASTYSFDTAYVSVNVTLTNTVFLYHDRGMIRANAPVIDLTEAITLIIIPSLQQFKINTPAYVSIYGDYSSDCIYMTHTEWNSFIDQLCDIFNAISGFIQNKAHSQILINSFASIENTIQSCLFDKLSTLHKIKFFFLGYEFFEDSCHANMKNLYCRLREIKAVLEVDGVYRYNLVSS